MIREDLLSILVCPESKQPVSLASAETVTRINQRVQSGQLRNKGGAVVTEAFEGVLVRQDGSIGYGIRQGIPIMLVEESFSIQ